MSDADFTLRDVWTEGVAALTQEEHVPDMPGATYEVAPGICGEMVWPTLAVQEEVREINSRLTDLFREDAEAEDFRALREASSDNAELAPEENPIKDGITVAEFDQTTTEVNVEVACRVLSFEESSVEPHDLDPHMASVVRQHFLALAPATNGQSGS